MEDPRREILGRVARGELTAEEGASLLDELDREGSSENQHDEAEPSGEARTGVATAGVSRIRIERSFGSVTVIGDPEVQEAVAEGPHRAERRDGTFVISNLIDDGAGFTFSGPGGYRWHRGWRHERRANRNWWREGFNFGGFDALRVRMNPDLPLEVLCQAGSLTVQGVRGPIQGDVQAGSASIDDFEGPLNLTLQAGTFRGRGRLQSGASRIHSEAGSIRLHLTRGSSVTIHGHTTMGRLSLGDQRSDDVFVLGGGSREMVVGDGEAALDVDSTMGSVRVTAD
jgi:hypothetical protein